MLAQSGSWVSRIAVVVVLALASSPSCSEDPSNSTDVTAKQAEQIAMLEALGYLDSDRLAPLEAGVTVYDKAKAQPGYNLYSSEQYGEAVLIDMEGNVLHRWNYQKDRERQRIRRAHLYENGDLLAVIKDNSIVKMDRDSNVLWEYKDKFHHDLFVRDDGRIYGLAKRAGIYLKWNKQDPIMNDLVVILNEDGHLLKRISLIDALDRSACCSNVLTQGMQGDTFHTNTIAVLDGRSQSKHPAFRAGDVLLSVRNLNLLAVMDIERETVTWATRGPWVKQHEPQVLDNGNLLLFDNRDLARGEEASRVIEFDPATLEIAWEFHSTRAFPLWSKTGGSVSQLPNGNVLISETRGGRAIEVTRNHEIAWEFYNPARLTDKPDIIARLYEVQRIRADFPMDWLSVSE